MTTKNWSNRRRRIDRWKKSAKQLTSSNCPGQATAKTANSIENDGVPALLLCQFDKKSLEQRKNSNIWTSCRTWQLATNESPPSSNTDSISLAIRWNLSSSNIYILCPPYYMKRCQILVNNLVVTCPYNAFHVEPSIFNQNPRLIQLRPGHKHVPWELDYVFWLWCSGFDFCTVNPG